MGTPAQLLERALALAEVCERPDLRRRLLQARARSADPRVRVLVVGEPKQGKSSLVNGLVGAPVCPVADDVAARVTGEGTDRLVQAEVELPRRLLDGLELVDTAGVGGVGAQRALRTVDLLPTADAVLVVSDASQEFTAPEMAFLEQAAALCPTVVCVLTKTDACPHWRGVRGLEQARAAADDLRRRSSRWQQVLTDGVTDLVADIDFDLRDRSRVVVREAEEAIDAQDPGPMWPELSEWLDRRIAAAVADSYVWAEQRSEWLAQRVIEQFARDGGGAVPALTVGAAGGALAGPGRPAAGRDGAAAPGGPPARTPPRRCPGRGPTRSPPRSAPPGGPPPSATPASAPCASGATGSTGWPPASARWAGPRWGPRDGVGELPQGDGGRRPRRGPRPDRRRAGPLRRRPG